MLHRAVHHALRLLRALSQAVEVLNVPVLHFNPAARSFSAPSSDRVSPNTVCPASSNSGTIRVPMNPVAPVKNTFIILSPSQC